MAERAQIAVAGTGGGQRSSRVTLRHMLSSEHPLPWLLPVTAVLIAFGVYPLLYALWLSLHKRNPVKRLNVFDPDWNWLKIFGDERVWGAIGHTYLYTGVAIGIELVLGLAIALLLDSDRKGYGVLRALMTLPLVVPPAVTGMMFLLMLDGSFGVLSRIRCAGEWLRVQLPVRPNGLVGWVRARDVELVRVQTRIAVDLSERRVTLYRRGREVLRVAAAIGAADTPTPTGSYYVNQRLIAPNPEGPFGPAALGISAFSPVLKNWVQGGPIAIHGTNRPDLTGRAASHGCIRVRNPMLVRLFRAAAVGTPVVIRL